MNIKSIILPLLILLSPSVVAQQDFSLNDVVGTFAGTSHVGPYANTKTVSEAHFVCMAEMPDGTTATSSFTSSGYSDYRGCMADYVPFKVPGAGEAGSCVAQTVSWGQCASDIPALPDGSLFSARNTENPDAYEGFASFQCSEGELVYQSGGCSRAVTECEAGEVVDWPVTTPAWAQESPSTPFIDKFGVERHTPKGRCYGRMPEALSGLLMQAKATTPEMSAPERYLMGAAEAPKRCFDGEWLDQPGDGTLRCDYIPKSCDAMTYQHPKGCEFDIPAGEHDEVFTNAKPKPSKSIGGVQAHCWDGEWEIKAASCTLSCAQSAPARTWTGSDAKACRHNNHSGGGRLAPGEVFVVNNIADGMIGSTSYECNDGQVDFQSDECNPIGCDGIGGDSWTDNVGRVCSHRSYSSSDLGNKEHDSFVGLSSAIPVDGGVMHGFARYLCKYGEWKTVGKECDFKRDDFCVYNPGEGPSTEEECLAAGGSYDELTETCCISDGEESSCNPAEPNPPSTNPGCMASVGPMPNECQQVGINCDCECGYWRTWSYGEPKKKCGGDL
jgi:hypothetical protein